MLNLQLSFCICLVPVLSEIIEITHDNYDYWLGNRRVELAITLLVLSDECKDCIDAQNELKIAATSLAITNPYDLREIVFARANIQQDKVVLSRLPKVKDVPTILFFIGKSSEPPITYRGRIKALDILAALNKFYESYSSNHPAIVQMNNVNIMNDFAKMFQRIQILTREELMSNIQDMRHHIVLLFYAPGCEIKCEVYAKIANAFKNEKSLKFIAFDYSHEEDVVSYFQIQSNPTIIWLPIEDREHGRLYGGKIDEETLLTFFNKITGIPRKIDGTLLPTTGRIKDIENLLKQEYSNLVIGRRIEYIIEKTSEIKKIISPKLTFAVNYYIEIFKKVKEGAKIEFLLAAENEQLSDKIAKRNITEREKEVYIMHLNIVHGILKLFFESNEQSLQTKGESKYLNKIPIKPDLKPSMIYEHDEL